MSSEDKRFFDGLLLGSIAVAVIIGVIAVVAFSVGPTDGLKQQITLDETYRPELELATNGLPPPSGTSDQDLTREGELVVIEGTKYLVHSYFTSPNQDKIMRILFEKTENNSKLVTASLNKESKGCISKGVVFADRTYDFDGPILFSTWDKEGERLLTTNTKISDNLLPDLQSCLQFKKWINDDSLRLTVSRGEDNVTVHANYIYTPAEDKLIAE